MCRVWVRATELIAPRFKCIGGPRWKGGGGEEREGEKGEGGVREFATKLCTPLFLHGVWQEAGTAAFAETWWSCRRGFVVRPSLDSLEG